MAEYLEGQGIKTHRSNDVDIKIVDGQSGATATDVLSIVGEGDAVVADTNDWGIPCMMEDESGNYIIPKTDDNGAQKVVIVADDDDSPQIDYHVHSAVVKDATDDHDVVITSGQKISSVDLTISSPGLFKYDVGIYDGVSTFTIYHTLITQPAHCAMQEKKLCLPETTGDGSIALRVRATNKDNQDNDAFSTVCYVEYP